MENDNTDTTTDELIDRAASESKEALSLIADMLIDPNIDQRVLSVLLRLHLAVEANQKTLVVLDHRISHLEDRLSD